MIVSISASEQKYFHFQRKKGVHGLLVEQLLLLQKRAPANVETLLGAEKLRERAEQVDKGGGDYLAADKSWFHECVSGGRMGWFPVQ